MIAPLGTLRGTCPRTRPMLSYSQSSHAPGQDSTHRAIAQLTNAA